MKTKLFVHFAASWTGHGIVSFRTAKSSPQIQERVRISQRVKAGLETARAKGIKLGRPRVAVDARRIATLRKSGASCATVCEETSSAKEPRSAPFTAYPKATCGMFLRKPRTDLSVAEWITNLQNTATPR